MLGRYVVADLVRNPRRTLATMVGVTLGVGLFCGVLFFVDGLSASMTQRAVAPLAIDMQRIVTESASSKVALTQTFRGPRRLSAGEQARVRLEIHNPSDVPANEVTVRSQPGTRLRFVIGSATLDGSPIPGFDDNPFHHGLAQIGLNLGTMDVGATHELSYLLGARRPVRLSDATVRSSFSSRESVVPIAANEPPLVSLAQLARMIERVPGVARATELSFADLGNDTLRVGARSAAGPAKIFGFDAAYARRDPTIRIVAGALRPGGAAISAEAATALGTTIGDTVTIALPDDSTLELPITAVTDLSRSRALFSSRRGGDLETFVYTRVSVVVSPATFGDTVLPAFERAITERGSRLKSPPTREIDVRLRRGLLDADPATALTETKSLASDITRVAAHQDYVLDNISNTLSVAAADADVAKRLFVFLGVPGALLAAMLAAYGGNVLAEAQRREQATLRIRGASRRHLRRMLALRTALLTTTGAIAGLVTGYLVAAAILGHGSLQRASTATLATSAVLGTLGGFLATGLALYLTGRRSIDREIAEDRAQLVAHAPLWRRARLDIVGVAVVGVGTVVALATDAFAGTPGSVYFGRSVQLSLGLLVLPVAVWVTGSLLAARILATALARSSPRSTPTLDAPLPSLVRRSIGRRPWAIGNGAIVVSLIVAIAVSLAAFTHSYDDAKLRDSRFALGADVRVTPTPTSRLTYTVADAQRFRTAGVADATPVIFGTSNVILRSNRTSDPANLAAIDPVGFPKVAPLTDEQFPNHDAARPLRTLRTDPKAVLLSEQMSEFLKAKPGDTIHIILVRATAQQRDVAFHVTGLFERLPGFPEGAEALVSIDRHRALIPSKQPDFFLASAKSDTAAGLHRAFASIQRGPANADHLQIDTRETVLARDQSSLAALNIAGLVDLDSSFALAMAGVAIAIFVFGLLLQRRREYVTLRAQGLEPRTIRLAIAAEAGTVAVGGIVAGLLVGTAMGYYFVAVLRPLFVLTPTYAVTIGGLAIPAALVLVATLASTVGASRLVDRLEPTELLRDE